MSGNNTVSGAAPTGAVPSGGYYSRPEFGADAQKHSEEVNARYLRMKHLEGGLKTQAKDIEGMGNMLRLMQMRWQRAANAGDTALMQDVKLQYDDLQKQMRLAQLAYAKSYGDYDREYSGYVTAWDAQNSYLSSQEEAEKQWRSTIRDSATVGAELKQVQEQIQKLTRQDNTGRVLTGLGNWAQNVMASSSNPGMAGQTYTPQNAKQIAELEAREKLLQEEYQWGLQFEDEALRSSEKFKTLSQQGLEKWKQMQAQQAQLKGKTALEHNADAFTAANDNPFVTAFNQVVQQYREDDSYQKPNDQWSQDQLDHFGYLFMTDTAKAWEYAEQVNNQISQEKAQKQKDAIAEKATASGWAGVGHTIGALATAPLALADVMDNLAEFAGRQTVTSKGALSPYDYSQAVVGGISKKLNEFGSIDASVPVIGGKGWGDLYSIGFSVAQSLIAGKVTKVSGTGALTLLQFMGQGAAAGVDSGLESGASGSRALAYGLISGAAEGFAEKIGVDNLMKLGSARTFKGFVKNLLKQSAAEGIEETVTAVLDSALDRVILGENSTFRKSVAEYEQSMSHDDAVRLAWTETIGGIVFDGLSGAISGGLGAGVRTAGANVGQSIQERRQQKLAATEAAPQTPQAAPETAGVSQPVSFQAEVQRQVAENMGGKKTAQAGTVALAAPTVQVTQEQWQQGQRLAEVTGRRIKFYEGPQSEHGYFDAKTGEIGVNVNGGDVLAQVFSHELTHSIEQAGAYEKLSLLVLNRMQDTGINLDNAREAKRQQYARQGKALPNQTAVDQELVAEYVSKHLLTNEQEIVSLVQQDRTLGQKIHDFFSKILAKLGNKNAQERAFLSKARDLYAKALRQTQNVGVAQEAGQTVTAAATETKAAEDTSLDDLDAQLAAGEITDEEYDHIRESLEEQQEEQYAAGERKYSLRDTHIQQMQGIGRKSINQFSSADIQATEQLAKQYWSEMGIKSPFFRGWFGDWREGDQTPIQIADQRGDTRGIQKNDDTGWDINVSGKVFTESKHFAARNTSAMAYLAYINDIVRKAVLLDSFSLGNAKSENSLLMHSLYAVADIGNGPELLKLYVEEMNDPNRANTTKRAYQLQNIEKASAATGGVQGQPPSSLAVATNAIHTVADLYAAVKLHDANFQPSQASKIVNADGTPKVVYHGTNAKFNTFHSSPGEYWFSEYEDYAESMMEERGGGEVKAVYLDMKNPYRAKLPPGQFTDPIYEAPLIRNAKAAGHDGVIIENDTADPLVAETFYVVFSPEQIKSATDNIGTFDGGNPDIRYSLADETEAATAEEKSEVDTTEGKVDLRSTMPKKAQDALKKAEREMLWSIADKLSVPKLAGRDYLQPIIQEMADEYLRTGAISQESRQLLFEKAYSQAVIVDATFYEQYKELKDHLRSNAVTISDRDKADIADFNDFRKRAFGTLRIVNEGGLPVDAAYQELQSIAPELFPEDITHPADQLMRMYDVGKSIQVTEKTVRDYYGAEEPEYRKWARNEFEESIANATGKLWEVKRFAEDKAAKETEAAPVTVAEAMEVYGKLKKARREFEKVSAKNLLTERDQQQVRRLLRHEIELSDLQPGVDNVDGITAVYEAKQEYEKLQKLITEYKRHLREQAKKKADALLKTANSWKDKPMGIAYSRETMERNIYDIVPDKALAQQIIDQYFTLVHMAEAAATRFKNEYRDRVRAMQLSQKVAKGNLVSEAHAVQLLGEAEDNIRMLENARGRIKNRDGKNLSEWRAVVGKLWAENPMLDRGKIEGAVKEFRKIYDELFQQMNEVRVANGYEPINYRNGYFPHFQPGDSDSILAQFGRALGIDTRIDALPTTINGLTHTFKPGIQWFGNAQERLGFNTAYDAVEGFDKYIEGCASVIHHTENIQNLRALASQIRYRTSDEGIRKQVDEIYERQGITDEEKQQLIQEIYAHGKFALSNFVTELDEYTNLLANKKSRYDRSIEAAMGRRVYTFLKAWEARVGANMIAGNLTSALTNFIPLTQAGAQMGKDSLLTGMLQTLQAYRADDGLVGMSTFLTNRRGSDPLVRTWAQKASGVLGKPMELIDGFVSESIVRGAYAQNLKQGMSEAEAMAQADAFAASVMADRSKGAMPTLLQASNPLFKAFTQFQLEVNNQFSEVFKDIPRRFKEKGLAMLAWVLLKYFLGAFLYNELYEKLIGLRPALDPIGMLCEGYDDLQTDGLGTAGKNLAVNALEQLPFSSGLTMIGVELDGGRIPASSAVPDFTALWDAATMEGWSTEKRWKEVQDELNKLAYVVPPFGGNQISKVWKGVKAYIQGGSYNVDAAGNDILQYPVYKDEPKDAFWSLVKAAFLGKSSLVTAQDWVGNGFDSLGAKQTAAYQDMIAAGVKDRDAYALIQSIQGAQETDEKKWAAVQRDVLRDFQVSGEGKAIVYYGLLASDKERELMDSLADLGADAGAVTEALMNLKDAGSKAADKLGTISKAKLTDEEKAVLVGSVIGTELLTESGGLTQYAKFDYAVQNGMSVDQYISYRSNGASIDDYLQLRDAGASIEDAMETVIALQELRNSVEDPTTVQKWRTVIGSSDDPEVQMASLSIVMTDSQYAKALTARGFGVSPKAYVEANELLLKYDADGNGSFTQAEVTRAVSAMRVSVMQKAVLWQLMTGSSSAKKNPYSETIGQRVIDALEKAKAEREKKVSTFQDEIMRQIMQNMGK